MTRDADRKRLIRARMRGTGETYTAARAAFLRQEEEETMRMVPCSVRVRIRKAGGDASDESASVEVFAQGITREFSIPAAEADQPVIVLTELDGSRVCPIFCGPVEATSIAFALQDVETARPMTHDLLRDVVAVMGQAKEVRVTEVKDGTFFAELVVATQGGEERTISCRPSDGVALAVRAGIPILVNESLLLEPKMVRK